MRIVDPPSSPPIFNLDRDIGTLTKDIEAIVNERKSRFMRYFSAKRHREELQDVVMQLETAKANFAVRAFDILTFTCLTFLTLISRLR